VYIRLTKSKASKHSTLQIVEGVRDGKKVKQKIVASLGVIKQASDLERLKRLAEHLMHRLEQEGLPPVDKVELKNLRHQRTIYDGFSTVVTRLIQMSGFKTILQKAQGKKTFDVSGILTLLLAQRFHAPGSKLRAYERQTEYGSGGFDLQHFYRSMDALLPLAEDFQAQAFKTAQSLTSEPADCFFFDVTTLYFESITQDELREFGFSKDQKHHSVQVVLALVVNSQGIPLAYEVFKGNLAETRTFLPVLESLKTRVSIKNATIVCDRGMASRDNISAIQENGFNFVIATKLKSSSKRENINDLTKYAPLPHQENVPDSEKVLFYTMNHPQYEDALLIATYSPHRAKKDREDRERLLEKLREKLGDNSNESSVKKVISNGGYKKYTNVKKGSSVTLNEQVIEAEAAWDGFHGIAVSNKANLSVTTALSRYKDLWRVEEAFRVVKCTLKTRPIFHWKPDRIRAHVLICFINLFLERFLEQLLKAKDMPLTPDRIRHTLTEIHTMHFVDNGTHRHGCMPSSLSDDGIQIFKALDLPMERNAGLIAECCV
jgi:transposase